MSIEKLLIYGSSNPFGNGDSALPVDVMKKILDCNIGPLLFCRNQDDSPYSVFSREVQSNNSQGHGDNILLTNKFQNYCYIPVSLYGYNGDVMGIDVNVDLPEEKFLRVMDFFYDEFDLEEFRFIEIE